LPGLSSGRRRRCHRRSHARWRALRRPGFSHRGPHAARRAPPSAGRRGRHPTRAFRLENLTADGFRAVGASGAGDGLRAIEVRQPALVILDPILEDGSGLALLDRVRSTDGLASRIDPELPVIVLTGRAEEADRVRSYHRGLTTTGETDVSFSAARNPTACTGLVTGRASGVLRCRRRRKIRRRQSGGPMVSTVDTTRPSSRLIIGATSCRRAPTAAGTSHKLPAIDPRPAGPSFRARLLASQARRPSGRPQTRNAF
jgi:CheY-like chemotaxis protein